MSLALRARSRSASGAKKGTQVLLVLHIGNGARTVAEQSWYSFTDTKGNTCCLRHKQDNEQVDEAFEELMRCWHPLLLSSSVQYSYCIHSHGPRRMFSPLSSAAARTVAPQMQWAWILIARSSERRSLAATFMALFTMNKGISIRI